MKINFIALYRGKSCSKAFLFLSGSESKLIYYG